MGKTTKTPILILEIALLIAAAYFLYLAWKCGCCKCKGKGIGAIYIFGLDQNGQPIDLSNTVNNPLINLINETLNPPNKDTGGITVLPPITTGGTGGLQGSLGGGLS